MDDQTKDVLQSLRDIHNKKQNIVWISYFFLNDYPKLEFEFNVFFPLKIIRLKLKQTWEEFKY